MTHSRPPVRRLRLIAGAALSLILTAAAVTVTQYAASAAVVGTPTRIVGAASGRCLDVPNSSTTNGVQIQLYDCSGAANQSWTYTSTKQLTVYGNKSWTRTAGAPPTAPPPSSGTATARPTSSGT